MARPKTGNKPADLQKAAIAELVEYGLSSASVNRIAKRAGLSVGTVYRYYDSKDALLRAVFMDLKRKMASEMMDAINTAPSTKEAIQRSLRKYAEFIMAQPETALFLETLLMSPLLSPEDREEVQRIDVPLYALLQRGVDEGITRDCQLRAQAILLLAPVTHFARRIALGGEVPNEVLMTELLDLSWKSIARENK